MDCWFNFEISIEMGNDMTLDIESQWLPYVALMPLEILQKYVSTVQQYTREDALFVVPSITMQSDGPVLSAIVAFTKTFAVSVGCEKDIEAGFGLMICPLADFGMTTVNVRKRQLGQKADGTPYTYDVGHVQARFRGVNGALSVSYVGEELGAWFGIVSRALPVTVLE